MRRAVWVLLLVSTAHAQQGEWGTRAEGGTTYYGSDEGLSVVSPWARANQKLTAPVTVGVGWHADVITGASVDVVTAATGRIEETRHEVAADVALDRGAYRGNAGYALSDEADTRTHLVTAGGQIDLFERNLTLGLAYALGLDRIGASSEPESLWRDRTMHRVDLTATQLLSPDTLVSGGYTLVYQSGFLASPYRQVPLFSRTAEVVERSGAQWVAERHPDSRGRHAGRLTLKHALTADLFGSLEWRGYLDSWAMRSHTGRLGLGAQLGARFEVELYDRLYWQSRASFYRGLYTVNRDFISRDRRLDGQLSNAAGLGLRARVWAVEALLRAEYHWTRQDDFRAFDGTETFADADDVQAVVLQAALALEL